MAKKLTIRTPVEGFTGVVAGVTFAGGVAEVEERGNANAIAYFRRHGYLFGDADQAAADDNAGAKPVSRMTTEELIAFAKENEIDLGEAKKKPEILAVVKAALEAKSGDGAGDNGGQAGDGQSE